MLEKLEFYKWETECGKPDELQVLFREPFMNIVITPPSPIQNIEEKWFSSSSGDNQWYKIVIMDHVGRSFILLQQI
jgi:hypothetical protein